MHSRRAGFAREFLLPSVVVGALVWARPAAACQTTTCARSSAPECVRDSASLCFNAGQKVSWRQACISYSIQSRGLAKYGLDYAATEALVSRAFERWLSASCGGATPSISAIPIGPLECNELEYNPEGPNANALLFRDGDWAHEPNALGLTTVTFNKQSGQILDADMEINVGSSLLNDTTVEYVVTHEAGHFLGLDHSADPSALMYAQYTPQGRANAELGSDDVSSICAAYPARDAGECEFSPEKGFDSRCGGDVQGGCSFRPAVADRGAHWLALAVLGGVCHGRRRRASRRA
ncbi:MAG: matrixin family metalloprotease [Polyangiaceae bacterium]